MQQQTNQVDIDKNILLAIGRYQFLRSLPDEELTTDDILFKCNWEFWLELQKNHEQERAKKNRADQQWLDSLASIPDWQKLFSQFSNDSGIETPS